MNLIEGNDQLGYIFAATLFSLFGLFFMWWCYKGVTERYVEAACQSGAKTGAAAVVSRHRREPSAVYPVHRQPVHAGRL
jgi:Na+/melibiose symporter-like transporter